MYNRPRKAVLDRTNVIIGALGLPFGSLGLP
jgi:hypothetical protein